MVMLVVVFLVVCPYGLSKRTNNMLAVTGTLTDDRSMLTRMGMMQAAPEYRMHKHRSHRQNVGQLAEH